jgi:hypothetical protein
MEFFSHVYDARQPVEFPLRFLDTLYIWVLSLDVILYAWRSAQVNYMHTRSPEVYYIQT